MSEAKLTIYAVSDATGDLAISVATAGVRQFKQENVLILRRARMRTPERLARVVREAQDTKGLIVFTLVSGDLRQYLLRVAAEHQVAAIDIMGSLMEGLSRYLDASPSDQPGLKYEIDGNYFRRNEAIEFAVKHDDGLGRETLSQADIVLIGISRTSKTPLSIYLSYRGFKTANIPIVMDVPIPVELHGVDRKRIIGLTIQPEKLMELRTARLLKMGRPVTGRYANLEFIGEELAYAQKIFARLGNPPVIDVTKKALEEVASEVLTVLGK